MTVTSESLRAEPGSVREFDRFWIGGEWVLPIEATSPIEVRDATTEALIARVPAGSAADIDCAVIAARAAQPAWAATPIPERVDVLRRVSALLKENVEELAAVIAAEVGMPLPMTKFLQIGLPRANFSNAAKILATYEFEYEIENSLVVREPIGVVGAITPWNYPLHQIALKVAPALAAGNTVVLKPSEVAPICTFMLADILHAAGVPAGAFNLVTGYGVTVGEALAGHPDVDMVSLTGSNGAGRRVAEIASRTIKRVALELGGKSASIILEDADLEQAVEGTLSRIYRNSGQTCTALGRMLVPRQRLAEVEKMLVEGTEKVVVGDPFDPATTMGPVVSETQRERVRGFIAKGIDEGARLLIGGAEPPVGLPTGYFVRPTVFSDVRPEMTIAREEIFGPVLAVIPYDTEDEAVAIANDSVYGLSGAVWSADASRALAVAKRIRTGQVEVNGGVANVWAPFGGYKQSGLGREAGRFGFEEYLETKAIQR